METMTDNDWAAVKNFSREELMCPHCGECDMRRSFVFKLQSLRERCGFPLIVNSGYRCPEYNNQISSTGLTGPHTTGRSADLGVSLHRGTQLLMAVAVSKAFTGVGIKQHGELSSRFVHLDDLEASREVRLLRPRVWTYV